MARALQPRQLSAGSEDNMDPQSMAMLLARQGAPGAMGMPGTQSGQLPQPQTGLGQMQGLGANPQAIQQMFALQNLMRNQPPGGPGIATPPAFSGGM